MIKSNLKNFEDVLEASVFAKKGTYEIVDARGEEKFNDIGNLLRKINLFRKNSKFKKFTI